MLGSDDLKVGKTETVNNKGERIVTEKTNKKTDDGKSIWTVMQGTDYENDGVIDSVTITYKTYDEKGRLINNTVLEDNNADNIVDKKVATTYEYNDDEKKYKKTKEVDEDADGNVDSRYTNEGVYNAKKPTREVFEEYGMGDKDAYLIIDHNYETGITEVDSNSGHTTYINKKYE